MGKVLQAVITIFLLVFLLTTVLAVQTFKQNDEVDLKVPVRLDGAVASGINCNISVYYPNSTVLIDYLKMTDNGDYFNYTLNTSQTRIKGEYTYCITCTNNVLNDTECDTFLINLGGVEPSQQRTETQTRTILIFFGLAVMLFISLFFVVSFPVKLTLFLLMCWFLLMGINFSYLALGDEIVNPTLENFFSFFLTLSFYANYFIFLTIIILWIITLITNVIQMKKQKKARKYGFEGIQ